MTIAAQIADIVKRKFSDNKIIRAQNWKAENKTNTRQKSKGNSKNRAEIKYEMLVSEKLFHFSPWKKKWFDFSTSGLCILGVLISFVGLLLSFSASIILCMQAKTHHGDCYGTGKFKFQWFAIPFETRKWLQKLSFSVNIHLIHFWNRKTKHAISD